MQRFDRPAGFDQAAGQPVQQLGMSRQRAHAAEVARRADYSFAEVLLPDAIDHHARGQGMLGRADPLCQLQPAAAGGDGQRLITREDTRQMTRHQGAELRITAADVNARVSRAGE